MSEEQPHNQPHKSRYNYKLFVAFSVALLVLSIGLLVHNYLTTGDWIKRGVELKGGSVISLPFDKPIDTQKLQAVLSTIPQSSMREIRGVSGYEIDVDIPADVDVQSVLSQIKQASIQTERASIRSVGSSLGSSFFFQVQVGIIVSFILMAIVVFAMFRTFAPSSAVLLAAFSDIIETMAFMQIFGIELTLPTFAALLMLIGYSVDTDLLLTARVLKGSSTIPIPERVKGAFRTGITMTMTTFIALTVLLISNLSPVLSQIASVLMIGIVFDILNTWIQNVAIIRRYAEKKGL